MLQVRLSMARRFRAMVFLLAATMTFPSLPDWTAAAAKRPAARDTTRVVHSMDVARARPGGTGRGVRRGLLIGAVAGAGAGIGVGLWANSVDDDALVSGVGGWAGWIGVFALAGAGVGALIGAIVGSTEKAERIASPGEEGRVMILPSVNDPASFGGSLSLVKRPPLQPAELDMRRVSIEGGHFHTGEHLKRTDAMWPPSPR